jgi:hypothetical protein
MVPSLVELPVRNLTVIHIEEGAGTCQSISDDAKNSRIFERIGRIILPNGKPVK